MPDQSFEIRVEGTDRPAFDDGPNDRFRARRARARDPGLERAIVRETDKQRIAARVRGVAMRAGAAKIECTLSFSVEADRGLGAHDTVSFYSRGDLPVLVGTLPRGARLDQPRSR